jgi:hypothetical protein
VNLAPASWIWFPSARTLPNTFVLFRRELVLEAAPLHASGFVSADSRYRLSVNGRRVGWGPAPCDPRELDVDPIDLTRSLRPGRNVLGVEVLFYGVGEGTWVAGKPGLILRLDITNADGSSGQLCSDERWRCWLDRAHRPGQYKRWFLRALQEEFDARQHPLRWDRPAFVADERWLPAMRLACPPDKPPICGQYDDYLGGDAVAAAQGRLRERSIPPLREEEVPALRLAESGRVAWLRDPLDWFEFRTPGAFEIAREPVAAERGQGRWELPATMRDERPTTNDESGGTASSSVVGRRSSVIGPSSYAVFATFEFAEQIVGWPYFTIDAPEGTIVELMVQESHDPARTAWLDTHMFSWSRFICREGLNRFECFDFESLRWLQLHIRNASRPVVIGEVGVRRRRFDWPNTPQIRCDEPALQRLFDAAINTLHNCAQETCVDGMGRERQQYSGDGGHQLQAIRYAFGETRLPARFLRTFSAGLARDGYFLDSWPAYDRLARIMQRQVDASGWGPLLDHGVGFCFDCWQHYLETGELADLREPYPRLLRFAGYLAALRGADGLLPVENLGVPAVWIDHQAYRRQRHKQCAFNLYVAAMFQHALAPIARAFDEPGRADQLAQLGGAIEAAAVARFWSAERGLFVNNLPWLAEEGAVRLCDRSLATAVLFEQCPGGQVQAAARALAECPPELGMSYPANACWRLWALARLGRIGSVLRDVRERWATMDSVLRNNTIQEWWRVTPDTADQWSHCAVVPLYILFTDILGIRPTEPGFTRCRIRPQLGDLGRIDITAYTVRGPIGFVAEPDGAGHRVALSLPSGCAGELLLPDGAETGLPLIEELSPAGFRAFRLNPGQTHQFRLRTTP